MALPGYLSTVILLEYEDLSFINVSVLAPVYIQIITRTVAESTILIRTN